MEKKKIFIIDDDLTFLKYLKVLFERENYNVITDRNSSKICYKVKIHQPDIILLDLLMPDNNGFQIFKQMKKDDYCSSIPVVVLTSHQNFNSKIQLLREGALDYIYKPFRKDELILRMRNYINYCSYGKAKPFDEHLLFNQLKEILGARKKQWIEPQLNKQSLYGYVYPDIRLVSNNIINGKERDLLEEWADKNLLERTLVDIIELCPVCFHYTVSLNYICPICSSINIEELSSEDSSHASFVCNDCGMNIKILQIRYHCLNCDEKFKRDKIVKQKIYKYKILSLDSADRKEKRNQKIKSIIQENKNTTHLSSSLATTESRIYYSNNNFVYTALKETNVPYVLPKRFRDRISKEIQVPKHDQTEITVMSIGIENLYQLTLKLKSEIIVKIFKGILLTLIKHLRQQDVISFNGDKHKILIMLPNTHLKIAKIIAERIQQKLDRFRTTFPLEINLASYPQDGKTAEEILAMMELGIEKINSHVFT